MAGQLKSVKNRRKAQDLIVQALLIASIKIKFSVTVRNPARAPEQSAPLREGGAHQSHTLAPQSVHAARIGLIDAALRRASVVLRNWKVHVRYT